MLESVSLKKKLLDNKTLVFPGVYDSLSASIAAHCGFKEVYVSGAAVSYSLLGKPDIGLVTMAEMVSRISNIYDSSGQTIIADGDTGYGNALNVIRTVKAYEKAGAAGIQLEDQLMPKRCGHMFGKTIIEAEEMAGKIKAACDARVSEDFLIIARTDANAVSGLEEAINRGHLYLESGADILFIEAPDNVEQMSTICKVFKGKTLMANMVEGGNTPILPLEELTKIGYSIVIYPGACARVVAKALTGLYSHIKKKGDTLEYLDNMFVFDELNEILKLSEIRETEQKYKHTKE